jgi:putative membrane protein
MHHPAAGGAGAADLPAADNEEIAMTAARLRILLLAAGLAILVWSGIGPRDRGTWLMEVTPALLALPILLATHRRFPLTSLLYVLVTVHAAILCVGGHYTYAEVPAGFWFRDLLGLSRNHYDRLGHLFQGLVPALIARELLLRKTPLRPGGWVFALATSVAMAVSALYELVEWLAAVLLGQGADAFLGTQGDPWDTQWDMFMALIGALLAQVLLSRWQDAQIARLGAPAQQPSGEARAA